LGLRLVNQLREALGEQVPLAIVFEASTPGMMSELLEKNYPVAIAHWTGRTASASRSTQNGSGREPAEISATNGHRSVRPPDGPGPTKTAPSAKALHPLAPIVAVNRESRRAGRA
jgi:hypothetical protein